MEKKIKFENENIWLYENGQITDCIGVYSFRDQNSWMPTKQKMYWASIKEHENGSDDFVFWEKSVPALRARVIKYLKNRENGIKDLPQISEQIKRMLHTAWEIAYRRYGYGTTAASNEMARVLRINLADELKKRGYWMINGYQLIKREIYNLM